MIRTDERPELEKELQHWEQQLDSEMTGYNEAPESVQRVLDQIGPKLEVARECLSRPGCDELESVLDELRMQFRKLDRKGSAGGPPMA